MSHRNWFLIIVEKYIIPIVWLSLLVSVLLTAATFFIDPIYSVKTELCLDASLETILPNIDGTPSINAGDFIRQEYFAINSINLMQQPEIGQQVIHAQGLTNNKGNKISANDFINPSVAALLFSNNGQGVTVKWISDTQQFSITGYGKDLDAAALLSSKYADSFLAYDKKQFKSILENLNERQKIILNTAADKRLSVEREQTTLRKEYGLADWSERLESLTASLAGAEQRIYSEELAEATDKLRREELEAQVNELKKTVHWSVSEKKSDTLMSLQNSLSDLNQQLVAAAVEYTPHHPEYIKVRKQIEAVFKQMTAAKKREYSQSTRSTSETLDSVLANLMEIREEQAVRSTTFAELNALKTHYVNELNYIGEGNSLYNNLEEKKSGLTAIIRIANQNIIEIEALIQQPFSFFRVVSSPFVDKEYINDFKYLPKRKLTLVISFVGIFFLSLFYILIRELHLETLFYAWQLRYMTDDIEAIDIVSNKNKKSLLSSVRHIFHTSGDTGHLFRIRRIDYASDPEIVAELGAGYYFRGGESTLLVNNYRKQPECPDCTGLHSWLTGHLMEATDGIKKTNKGYDILCDAHWNHVDPWVRDRQEIKDLFSILAGYYKNIILVDPSLNMQRRAAGDFIVPDVDILTVNGGELSTSQVIEIVEQEKQTCKGKKTVVLVINKKESINPFSGKGLFMLFGRFLKAPIGIIYQ